MNSKLKEWATSWANTLGYWPVKSWIVDYLVTLKCEF